MKIKLLLLLLLTMLLMQDCKNKGRKRDRALRDKSINKKTSFNNLFFDSTSLDKFITNHNEYDSFIVQFKDFYSHRNYEFAWFDSGGLAEQAKNFMNLQNDYVNEFDDSSIINPELPILYDSLMNAKYKLSNNDTLGIKAELLLTGQFFRYAAKVYKGSDIDAAALGWFIPRKKIDLTALLANTISSKSKDPDLYAPQNDQYKKLQSYLIKYAALEKEMGNDTIPFQSKLMKLGDSSIALIKIKQKLFHFGDLSVGDTTIYFDSSLFAALKQFQKRHGLLADGVIGNKLLAELNVPANKRIQQILINMERARWMPAEKDSNYILVNLPEYKMHVYDGGKLFFDMNVIVGSAANSSVIFNGKLKYIVFSPYWNLPESIVKKEVLPSMDRNRNYIKKNNMEITGYSGKIPQVRQKPGPNNSLGLVKFLFPNNYNIYFHDTPFKELFSQSSRNLSHGCIRLGDPKKFATYLLRFDSSWNNTKIDEAMHLGKEKWVTLKKSIQVFLVYYTAWVDKNGSLNFRKDIYGHDQKMGEKLFAKQE